MKASLYTLGCKVNQYETEYMTELLKNAGFDIVEPNQDADYYIINSCTVTATADQKTRQSIRKFKRNHPNSTVILTGCMPQAFPEEARALTQADIVFSNRDNGDILSMINKYNTQNKRIVEINPHKTGDKFSKCSISQFNNRIRAFVKIEDGCDRFCSYCIIPKSRGRVRSKSIEDLKQEVEALAKNGIKEIVLVGINLSAYGKGEHFNITDAVKICNDTDGILRVRLGSLEPDHITDDIIEKLTKAEKFCPQFHISLQSGCTKTLKSMNRHYTAEDYRNLCNKLKASFDELSLTTDVMVGYNEESDDDFNKSLEFVKSIGFEKVHVFPYSQREGTAASMQGDSVTKEVKEKRASIMIKETNNIRHKYFASLVGKKVNVLIENQLSGNEYQGYTEAYVPVRFSSCDNIIGRVLNVTIKRAVSSDYCIAE